MRQLATTRTRAPSDGETIRFLYSQRLTLFNTRREHEWKIYFGALVLLGAVDAVIVTGDLVLKGGLRWGWVAACAFVFIAVWGYESRLQIRNDGDRKAMDKLYNQLCELAQVDDTDVRAPVHGPRCCWNYYGWAFPWQMTLLLVAATVSAYLPWVPVARCP